MSKPQSPKRRKTAAEQPRPAGHVVGPPEILDAAARDKWAEVLPILQSRGDVDQGALDALAAYCAAWSQWRGAQEKVNELGLVVKSPTGFPQENPYAVIARKAQCELRRWADVLGLTPAARKRIGIARKKPDPAEPAKDSLDTQIRLFQLERSLKQGRAAS